MKWRRPTILFLLIVGTGTAFLVWQHFFAKPEPSYNGKPLSFYVRRLYSTNLWDRATYLESTNAFFNLGMDAAPYLAQALGKRDFKLYRTFLAKLPDGLGRHLPQPLDAQMVRSRAYSLLSTLGPTARSAVPNLIPQLRSSDTEIADRAAYILGRIGPDARAAVPALIALLNTAKGGSKNAAVNALGSIGFSPRDAREALPLLIEEAKTNSDAGRRVAAVKCLGMIGHDASPAVPGLVDALKDPESRARAPVASALGSIGPGASSAVPALTEMTKDEWWYVRENAATALGKIGFASKPAIPALVFLRQNDQNQDVRSAATEAIKLIQPDFVEPTTR